MLIFLLLLCNVIKTIFSSDCVVSQWTGWSQCYGTCSYSVQIRNRDVLVPALLDTPNFSAHPQLPQCPRLYETRYCELEFCTPTSQRPMPESTVSREFFYPTTITPEHLNMMEEGLNKGALNPSQVMKMLHQQQHKNEIGNQLDQLDTSTGISTGASKAFTLQYPEFRTSTQTAATSTSQQRGYLNRLTIDFHDALNPSENQRSHRDSTPQPTQPNESPSIDPRLLQSALRKNRRLFKSLYKSLNMKSHKIPERQIIEEKQMGENIENEMVSKESISFSSTTTKARPPIARRPKIPDEDPDPELLTTDGPMNQKRTESLEEPTHPTTKLFYQPEYREAAENIDAGTWQRNTDYVPNTKRHASEITDMLYMTKEILQQLTAEATLAPQQLNGDCTRNPRCCKIERSICPDGTPVYYVKRYYREVNEFGSPICTQYDYPACDSNLERNERPILFEQNCQDLCFADPHRHIDPLYQLKND